MNTPLSQREHARLARDLIAACGGLDEAARNCRVSKSVLSTYQSPHEATSMPADIVDALQCFCGQRLYADALCSRAELDAAAGSLRDMACDLTEGVAELQGLIRRAIADDRLTPRELDSLARAETEAARALEQLTAARRAAETQRPLRAVGGERV